MSMLRQAKRMPNSIRCCQMPKQPEEMKVPFSVYFDGSCLQILNEASLIESLNEHNLADKYLDCTAQEEYQAKSSQALGYFWGEIAVRALEGLRQAGYDVSTKEAAIDYILPELPSGRWVTEVKRFGKPVKTSAISIGSLGKKEMHELTDELIRFIAEWFSIACSTPEEYFAARRNK